MRPKRNQKWRILLGDWIEVDTECDHPFYHLKRRLNMMHACLDRPRAVTGDITTRSDGNGTVLMPAERPVGRCRFVEQDGADRAGGRPERIGGDVADRAVG